MEDKSRLTAIVRKGLSAPIKRVAEELKALAPDKILHHGCGKAEHDGAFLWEIAGTIMHEYDPNFAPDRSVLLEKYDLVISNFVLNVLPPEDRQEAWMDIMMCVNEETGVAYITVRSDRDTSIVGDYHADGFLTKRGTFQKGYQTGDLIAEAESFFNNVSVTSHGHYRTAVCSGPIQK